ncbi:hypothetical protein SDC9_185426 [bioreactor metagenome]|uniref:Uncharacterized protein n=1 Tax=bioreactor metagenome TaxID=1076179 RepID=A0A645HFU3_9ZZZZ
MRVKSRITNTGSEFLHIFVGQGMLKIIGLRMPFGMGQSGLIGEVALPDPVHPDDT